MRKAHEKIKQVVMKDFGGQASFSKLAKKLKLESPPISPSTLALNLRYLKDIGEMDCIQVPDPKNPERKRLVWVIKAPTTYHETVGKEIVKKIVNENLFVSPGEIQFAPSFMMSSSEGDFSSEDLDGAAVSEFTDKVNELMWDLPLKKQTVILGFAARCIWLGFLKSREEYQKLPEDSLAKKMEKVVEKRVELLEKMGKRVKLEPLPERMEVENLKNLLLMETVKSEYGAENLANYMLDCMEFVLKNGGQEKGVACGVEIKAIPLPAYKARLLAHAFINHLFFERGGWIGHLANLNKISSEANRSDNFNLREIGEIDEKIEELNQLLLSKLKEKPFDVQLGHGRDSVFFSIETIPSDISKNIKWLKAHKQEFLDFIKKVDEIRFAKITAVGFPELDTWPEGFNVPKRVDNFLDALERAPSWEGREFELQNLVKTAEQIEYRAEFGKGMPMEKAISFELDGKTQYAFNYAFGPMTTPLTLYKHDPRTREIGWWKEFKKVVEKAMMKKFTPPKLPRQVRRAKP